MEALIVRKEQLKEDMIALLEMFADFHDLVYIQQQHF